MHSPHFPNINVAGAPDYVRRHEDAGTITLKVRLVSGGAEVPSLAYLGLRNSKRSHFGSLTHNHKVPDWHASRVRAHYEEGTRRRVRTRQRCTRNGCKHTYDSADPKWPVKLQ